MKKNIFLSLLLLSSPYLLLAANDDVVVTAQKEGHTSFHDAVMSSGLYEHAKKQAGEKGSMAPFTVFVPTNEAFEPLKNSPAGTQKKLLTFHVVPGKKVEDLAKEMETGVPTVGEQLLFYKDEKIFLDDSDTKVGIVKKSIAASNGIIYIIDGVILPSGTTLPSAPAAKEKEAEHSKEPVAAKEEAKADVKVETTQEVKVTETTEQKPKAEPKPEAKPVEKQEVKTEAKHEVKAEAKAHEEKPVTKEIIAEAPKPAEKAEAPKNNEPALSEKTAQTLAASMTQLTQSIQLLIHVIQQAQTLAATPAESIPAQTVVVP